MRANENMPVYAFSKVKSEIFSILKAALGEHSSVLNEINVSKIIEVPPDPKLGDFASPIAISLAGKLKQAPKSIAENMKQKTVLPSDSLIARIEAAKNGYLNFFLNWKKFASMALTEILEMGLEFGVSKEGIGKKVIVEHTSANPNKPLHMGTMRCAVIGDLVARVFRLCGYQVEVQNYMDNLGRQIAILVWRSLNHPDSIAEKANEKIDFTIGKSYVKASSELEEHPEKEQEVSEIIRKMEEEIDPESKLGREIVEKAVQGQLETAWRMNIFYDLLIWESDVIQSGLFNEVLEKMLKSRQVYKIAEGPDSGCIVVDMAEFGERFASQEVPYKIIVRSNGVTTYTGRDIGLHFFKVGLSKKPFNYQLKANQPNSTELWETNPEGLPKETYGSAGSVINVIGVEQDFPQQVVFHALKIMGYEEEFQNSHHLKFEHVWLPDQKFSGRKGTWIGFHADAALDKAVSLAHEEVNKRHEEFSEQLKADLAEKIGVGAVKYYIAKFKTDRKIVVKWEDVLNFEGNSCPYIQYAFVRTRGILGKAGEELKPGDYALLTHQTEHELILQMARLPELITNISQDFSIHLIAEYLQQLADSFTKFYHACQVLKAPSDVRTARLALVKCVNIVFQIGLERIMGIETPEKM